MWQAIWTSGPKSLLQNFPCSLFQLGVCAISRVAKNNWWLQSGAPLSNLRTKHFIASISDRSLFPPRSWAWFLVRVQSNSTSFAGCTVYSRSSNDKVLTTYIGLCYLLAIAAVGCAKPVDENTRHMILSVWVNQHSVSENAYEKYPTCWSDLHSWKNVPIVKYLFVDWTWKSSTCRLIDWQAIT